MPKLAMCDWSKCEKSATWKAYLDDLSFCLEHSYEWRRKTAGYGEMMEDSMAKNKAALEKILAGPMTNSKLNEAVARKLGWEYKITVPGQPMSIAWIREGWVKGQSLPDYCRSIEAAWECVSVFEQFVLARYNSEWVCSNSWDTHVPPLAISSSAPMAICLAFLKVP